MKLKDVKTFVTVPPSGIGGSFWVIVKVATGRRHRGDRGMLRHPLLRRRRLPDGGGHVRALRRGRGSARRGDLVPAGVLRGLHPAAGPLDDGRVQRDSRLAIWTSSARRRGSRSASSSAGGSMSASAPNTYHSSPGAPPRAKRPAMTRPTIYHDGDAAAERALDYVEMGFTAIKQDPAGPVQLPGRARAFAARAFAQRVLHPAHPRGGRGSGRHPVRHPRADDHLVGHPSRPAPGALRPACGSRSPAPRTRWTRSARWRGPPRSRWPPASGSRPRWSSTRR